MIDLADLITPAITDAHLAWVKQHVEDKLYRRNVDGRLSAHNVRPQYWFEHDFYQAIAADPLSPTASAQALPALRQLICLPPDQLQNFTRWSLFQRHRLFFFLSLGPAVQDCPAFRRSKTSLIKRYPEVMAQQAEISAAVRERLKKVISYDTFSSVEKSILWQEQQWHAYRLTASLTSGCCPWCNFIATTQLQRYERDPDSNEDRLRYIMRPALDHVLDQHRYPFFSLSIYNLVASCDSCNSVLKGTKDFWLHPHVMPYQHHSQQEVRFQLRSMGAGGAFIRDLYTHGTVNLESIEIGCVNRSTGSADLSGLKMAQNLQTFQITERYNEHKHKKQLQAFIDMLQTLNEAQVERLMSLGIYPDKRAIVTHHLFAQHEPRQFRDAPQSVLKHDLISGYQPHLLNK